MINNWKNKEDLVEIYNYLGSASFIKDGNIEITYYVYKEGEGADSKWIEDENWKGFNKKVLGWIEQLGVEISDRVSRAGGEWWYRYKL